MDYVTHSAKYLAEAMGHCKSDKKQYSVLKRSLSTLVRNWCDKYPVTFISEQAKSTAEELSVNLFEMQWKDQTKFDKTRKVFHLEHKYAVSDMIEDMVANPELTQDIFNNSEFGWILKSEDALLKSHNRKDHDVEYAIANISLIKR